MPVPDTLLLNDRQQRADDWYDTVQPKVYVGTTLYEFPRPIRKLWFRDAWEFDRYKIPLKDGEVLAGQSRNGVRVFLEGQIAHHDSAEITTLAGMFDEVETMRSQLDANETNGKYEFFFFHDSATPYYRKLKDCTTLKFEVNLTTKNLFSYSVEIHSDDAAVYTSAPGS